MFMEIIKILLIGGRLVCSLAIEAVDLVALLQEPVRDNVTL